MQKRERREGKGDRRAVSSFRPPFTSKSPLPEGHKTHLRWIKSLWRTLVKLMREEESDGWKESDEAHETAKGDTNSLRFNAEPHLRESLTFRRGEVERCAKEMDTT